MNQSDEASAAPRALLFWSGGKDAAWALYHLQQDPSVEVAGLLTTFNSKTDRSAMHAVRMSLIRRQASAADLPLVEIAIPWPCPNAIYEDTINSTILSLKGDLKVQALAFGDLFVRDIREYREKQFADLGLKLLFPIWGMPTRDLALEMIKNKLQARIICVDSNVLPQKFTGREFDLRFLEELPSGIDPCGENGEFHTFVWNGPMFKEAIPIERGKTQKQEFFVYTDFLMEREICV